MCNIHNTLAKKNNGTERERSCSVDLGNENFTKAIFRPIERLILIGSQFPERFANFSSVLSRENSTVVITIYCIVHCFL